MRPHQFVLSWHLGSFHGRIRLQEDGFTLASRAGTVVPQRSQGRCPRMTVIPDQEQHISLSILVNRKFDLSWDHRELPDNGRSRNGKKKRTTR